MQASFTHFPCAPQSFVHIGIEQAFPVHPTKQPHPLSVHLPCPEQKLSQIIILQFFPL